MKVSDSLVNVPNELSQLGTDRPTNRQSDQLLELLEWLYATKKVKDSKHSYLLVEAFEACFRRDMVDTCYEGISVFLEHMKDDWRTFHCLRLT